MATGKVKWFNHPKGYGFIQPDDGAETDGCDIYIHISVVENAGIRTLNDNQKVSYTLVKNKVKDNILTKYWADDLKLLE